jgi:hypothetical protein
MEEVTGEWRKLHSAVLKNFVLAIGVIFVFEAQQPKSGVGHLVVEVSKSHTIRLSLSVSFSLSLSLSWQDSSERVISSLQRQLLTRHTTKMRYEHPCPSMGFEPMTGNRAAADLWYYKAQIKENEIGEVCNTCARNEKSIQHFGR